VVEVVATRESKSKPDRGIVTFAFTTYNQKDEVVMTYECMDMIRREPKA
jgi:acyl dehydratase